MIHDIFSALKKLFIHTKASVKGMPKNLSDDIKGIKFEIRTIKKQIKNMENKSHFTYIKAKTSLPLLKIYFSGNEKQVIVRYNHLPPISIIYVNRISALNPMVSA